MKQGTDYRVGPGMTSLLLIFFGLCMATLALLGVASLRVDSTLTERSQEATLNYYEAAAQVQRTLFEVDENLVSAREQAQGDVEAYKALVEKMIAQPEAAVEAAPQEEEPLNTSAGAAWDSEWDEDEEDLTQGSSSFDEDDEDEVDIPQGAPVAEEEERDDIIRMLVVATVDEGRRLEALLEVPLALDGPRYVLKSHQVVHTGPWEAEQSIGFYASPEFD